MGKGERRGAYAILWVLALAFGWIEAAVVVYLREAGFQQGATDVAGFQVTLVSLPGHLVAVELVREACTLLLLGAVAWLAGRRIADRAGAFLLSFGLWDLTYYAVLRLVSGWPDRLAAWDVLFLIPVPWIAPVWAPVIVAVIFVGVGSYLFWTPERQRTYRRPDVLIFAASLCLTLAAFLAGWRAVADHRLPDRFPAWLFWAGVALGAGWFVRVEWRPAASGRAGRPWAGLCVRPILMGPPRRGHEPVHAAVAVPAEIGPSGLDQVLSDYRAAKRRLDDLLEEARGLGERLARVGQALAAHPQRTIVGLPEGIIEDPSRWDLVPGDPLPTTERLTAMTDDIREAARNVDELRDRLVLGGRGAWLEQPDEFFH
jgi:hypothetical protein